MGRKFNVNKLLISTGNGSLTDVRGFKNKETCAKFVTELSKQEIIAQRKGLGAWKGTEHVSWWRKIFSLIKK